MRKKRLLGILAALVLCWLLYKVVAGLVWLAVLCVVLACVAAFASRVLSRPRDGLPRGR